MATITAEIVIKDELINPRHKKCYISFPSHADLPRIGEILKLRLQFEAYNWDDKKYATLRITNISREINASLKKVMNGSEDSELFIEDTNVLFDTHCDAFNSSRVIIYCDVFNTEKHGNKEW